MAGITPIVRAALASSLRLARTLWRSTIHPLPPSGLDQAGQWQLLEMVYSDRLILIANLVLVTLLGGFGVLREPAAWSIGWLLTGQAVAVLRLVDFYRFRHRRNRLNLPQNRRRFIAVAWLLAAHWGSASLCLPFSSDPVIHFWFFNAQAAFISVAAARSSPIVRAAYGQIILVMLPTVCVMIAASDPVWNAYTILALLFAASTKRLTDVTSGQTRRLLHTLRENADLVAHIRSSHQELAHANQRLEAMAATDGLTGIANRRAFDHVLATEWNRAVREGGTLTLLLIDIDHFKPFNDRFGHQAGDDALRKVAACIDGAIMRPGDTAARYGGEEFAAILPNTDGFGAVDTAERIRRTVEALAVPAAAGKGAVVTVSLGAATIHPQSNDLDPIALIAAADRQLYKAKRESRNCVRAEILAKEQSKEGLLL